MMRNMAACLGLLNVATGGEAVASHSAYVIWYLRGRDAEGQLFLLSDGLGVGYGARPHADGNDAVYLVAQENFPSEFLDSVFPVRVKRYAINPDTGGPGRWRGGCGLIREIEVLAPEAMVSMRIDSVTHPPWGVAGGHAAGTGRCIVNPGTARRAHPQAPERRQYGQARRYRAHRNRGRRWLGPSLRPGSRPRRRRRARWLCVRCERARRTTASCSTADGINRRCGRHRQSSGAAPRGKALPPSRLSRRAGLTSNPSEARRRCT